jgi:hypothetical protein
MCERPAGGEPASKTMFHWEGRIILRGWRSKLIFLFIVYFAGFATAIYMLAPTPESDGQTTLSGFVARHSKDDSRITSDEFVESFNTGMHKCVDFGKEAACRTAKFLKEKYKEKYKKMEDA